MATVGAMCFSCVWLLLHAFFILKGRFCMICYGKCDFLPIEKKTDDNYMARVSQYMLDREVILKAFSNYESVVFFTDRRIIFTRMLKNYTNDFTFLRYSSILHYAIISEDKLTQGKLEISLPDGNTYSFLIDELDDAIEFSKKIEELI